jgi:predicted permease
MMRDILEVFSRLLSVFRRRALDQEFNEEFTTHIDLLTDQNERRGLPRDEARRRAILQMGGLNATTQIHREARGLQAVERLLDGFQGFVRDLIHAARSLAKARSHTVVCVASLGIGIGTFFALVTLTRWMTAPAPGVKTDGLVELLVIPHGPLRAKAGFWAIERWSYPDFEALRRADTGIAITGWTMGQSDVEMPDGAAPVPVPTMFVSANYFSTVGVTLARGPGFGPSVDDGPSPEPRVVLGYHFWQTRLGSDPDIVGKPLTLDGVPHVVSGIVPEGFSSHESAFDDPSPSLFVPLGHYPRLRADPGLPFNRDIDWVGILGRLASGVGIAQANATVSALMSTLAKEYPATNEFKAASVEPYYSQGAASRPRLRVTTVQLLGLSGMVLLIVCLNLSGMMLVRSAIRERELSVRQAVGAGRLRLIRYLLSEAFMLAGLGAALSALVIMGIPAVVAWRMRVPLPPGLAPDAVGFGICAALCLAASLMFGLLPAIRFSRPNLITALKDDTGGGGRRVGRLHRLAAALQLGIVIPFLVASGLLLDRVRTADFGFETAGLVAARLDPEAVGSQRGGADLFLQNVVNNLKQANGVVSVTMADGMPLDFDYRIVRAGRPNGAEFVSAHVTRVDERYLETIGAPLLRGRNITAEDRAAGTLVAVISESLALRLFPEGDAIGGRLEFALDEWNREQVFTIVGVSADFATSQLTTPRPQMLLPLPQQALSRVLVIARDGARDETRLTSAFENAIREFDPQFVARVSHPVNSPMLTGRRLVETGIEDVIAESMVAGGSGAALLILAALGVFGVVGLMVVTRTREIAVRIALGATRWRVLLLVLSDVVKLVMPGVVAGLLVAVVLARTVLSNWAMGAVPAGPLDLRVESLIYMAAVAIALLVALLAGLPATRRASSVEPIVAMRSE